MKKFIKGNYKLILGIVIGIVLSYLLLSKDKELKNDVEKISNTNNTEEVELGDTATYFDSINVHYDNTSSGLTNNTVKEAIDELYDNLLSKECAIGYVKQNATTKHYECNKPICKAVRNASDLHTEICEQTGGDCYADGYSASGSKGTTTITYGTIWDGVSALKAGDAFDCDVNNDGTYDAATERFYYISSYFNTDTQTFDDTTGYATLIYYKDYKKNIVYYQNDNWHGPRTPIASLPNTTGTDAWRDDLLKTRDRKILSCNNASCATLSNKTNNGSKTITYTSPIYDGKAARLLTLKEVANGCGLIGTDLYSGNTAELSNYNFLFENTTYIAPLSSLSNGSWLENPIFDNSSSAWFLYRYERRVGSTLNYNPQYSARPAIDVMYSDIAY